MIGSHVNLNVQVIHNDHFHFVLDSTLAYLIYSLQLVASFFCVIMQWGNAQYMATYMHTCFLLFTSADDASRVILSVPDSDGSDYINASFIDVCR